MRLGMSPCYYWVTEIVLGIAFLRTYQYVHCGTLVGLFGVKGFVFRPLDQVHIALFTHKRRYFGAACTDLF